MNKISKVLLSSLIIIAVLSFTLWMGCEKGVKTPVEPATQQETIFLTKANPQVQAAMAVQERHTDEIMAKPEVVGIGIGATEQGEAAIVIFTKAIALEKTTSLPKTLEGVPVIVKVTGEIKALKGKPPKDDPTARFDRPVPIGVSTGHPNITAGTIGCRVTDGSDVYALSNNHVYADENRAHIGDNVLQPGPYDGGVDPDDAIGTLHAYQPINFGGGDNTIDAAIALSSTSLLGNATPSSGYGTPKSATIAAAVGMKVKKFGRTTSQTKGTVDAINATVDVGYDSGTARFVDQIVITPGSFSAGGDSGSLIVFDGKGKTKADDRRPVGLLFAGSTFHTIANPIDAVLSHFGVSVDGE